MESMDSMPTSMPNGYPVEIVNDTIDKKYLCGHCHLILREPMQSFCGHRFCKNCTVDLLKTAEEVPCPACEEEGMEPSEYTVIKAGQIFPDNAMKREFLSWKVQCTNAGCKWNGSFKEYEKHSNICEFRCTPCECGRRIPVKQYEQHRQTECPKRLVECPHCGDKVLALEEKLHAKTCPKMSIQCDVCLQHMLREKLAAHYESPSNECSARRVNCPYGCGEYVDPMSQEKHEQESLVDHVRAINLRVMRLEGRPPGVTSGTATQTVLSSPVQVSSEMKDLKTKISILEKTVTTHLGHTSAQSMSSMGSQGASTSKGAAGGAAGGGGAMEELQLKVQVLEEKVQAFLNATTVLDQSLERNTTSMETTAKQQQENHRAVEQRVKNVERSLAVKDLTIAEVEQRIKTLEVSSYDGVLLWKVTDFARKRQEAVNNRTTSIYSPPFYTSRTGYKMCARMYLNGDGMGKGSYISLFFVIMRNEYDALMRWPFRQKVSMILIDQNNREHIIDAFRPDPSSSSFRRPTSEMNIASGCPLFCPLSSLASDQHAYVKDDTMYIKIITDISDLGVTS